MDGMGLDESVESGGERVSVEPLLVSVVLAQAVDDTLTLDLTLDSCTAAAATAIATATAKSRTRAGKPSLHRAESALRRCCY
jgi:hypothetical protein